MSWECDNHYGRTPEGAPDPNYGKILLTVALADGSLAPEEAETARGIAVMLNTPPEAIDEAFAFDTSSGDLAQLITPGATPNRALVYDTLRVAGGDGNLGQAERDKAKTAADMLGVDGDTFDQLASLVEEEYQLRQRKADLIFPDGQRV